MILNNSQDHFMREALKEAILAFEADEVPIGAVVVHGNRIIGRGHNLTERLNDVTAHAEMQAFTAAANFVNGKYLTDCTLYVTIEPCVMCAGALYWSKLSKVVWGASDIKNGFSRVQPSVSPFHPKTEIITGVMEQECAALMKIFFQNKRK